MYINERGDGRKREREKEMTSEKQQGSQLNPDETARRASLSQAGVFLSSAESGGDREAQASDGASWLVGTREQRVVAVL